MAQPGECESEAPSGSSSPRTVKFSEVELASSGRASTRDTRHGGFRARSKTSSSSASLQATMHPLLQAAASSGGAFASIGHTTPNDADVTELYRGDALFFTPLENNIFREHTVFFGLRFKPWGLERIFLNGRARAHKKIVPLGYFLLLAASCLDMLKVCLGRIFRPETCEQNENVSYCNELGAVGTSSTYISYLKYELPLYLGFCIFGVTVHVCIHKLDSVKDKSWAMLSVFLTFFLLGMSYFITIIATHYAIWPDLFLRATLEGLTIYIFFSGTPTFSSYSILLAMNLIIFFGAYPISKNQTANEFGEDSNQYLKLTTSFSQNAYLLCLSQTIIWVGAFFNERQRRKQFLQRMIIMDQQEEIIQRKTQNSKLQKKLLENILPTSIVSQLQEQNFSIQSWNQLRRLSRRHIGVCIMFAELDGFTKFSAEVRPTRVLEYLNDLFEVFDGLCDAHDVYKVETVGDQYVAAVGVVTGKMHNKRVFVGSQSSSATDMGGSPSSTSVKFEEVVNGSKDQSIGSNRSTDSLAEASEYNTKQMIGFAKAIIDGSRDVDVPPASLCPMLRVGIHTGTCMSGIVGTRNFRFCLFGDAMNTAARMEQTNKCTECIQTTQDVVDLVPEESWEKLKKIEVKGKGLMQTYLLRVGELNTREAGISNAASEDSGLNVYDETTTSRPFTLRLTRRNTINDADADADDGSRYEDITPVKESVYKAKTTLFGLWFKSLEWERAYMDGEARLVEFEVYVGYLLYVLVLLSNILFGYINYKVHSNICENPGENYKTFCITTFGENAYQMAQTPGATYSEIINYSLFRMTPAAGGVLFGLNAIGPLTHWLIHRSNYVQNKSWAIMNVWVIYVIKMVVILAIMYYSVASGNDQNADWPWGWGPVISTQGLLLVFFTGVPMKMYLLWWIIATILFYGLSLPLIFRSSKNMSGTNYSITIAEYIRTCFLLFIYGCILVTGKYFKDINNRKRFLQRVIALKQQDLIIKEKTKNEDMQRQFLENILPSSLVEQLEITGGDHLSPLMRIRELTQNHFAVSMLYADIVGFTSFSAQVDPFKVMVFLNKLFHVFDGLCDEHSVYKIETVGDCYVAAVGVVTGEMVTMKSPHMSDSAKDLVAQSIRGSSYYNDSARTGLTSHRSHVSALEIGPHNSMRSTSTLNARNLLEFAKAMLWGSRSVTKPEIGTPAVMRIGVHTVSATGGAAPSGQDILLTFFPLLFPLSSSF